MASEKSGQLELVLPTPPAAPTPGATRPLHYTCYTVRQIVNDSPGGSSPKRGGKKSIYAQPVTWHHTRSTYRDTFDRVVGDYDSAQGRGTSKQASPRPRTRTRMIAERRQREQEIMTSKLWAAHDARVSKMEPKRMATRTLKRGLVQNPTFTSRTQLLTARHSQREGTAAAIGRTWTAGQGCQSAQSRLLQDTYDRTIGQSGGSFFKHHYSEGEWQPTSCADQLGIRDPSPLSAWRKTRGPLDGRELELPRRQARHTATRSATTTAGGEHSPEALSPRPTTTGGAVRQRGSPRLLYEEWQSQRPYSSAQSRVAAGVPCLGKTRAEGYRTAGPGEGTLNLFAPPVPRRN
jgi:hypothetical protein